MNWDRCVPAAHPRGYRRVMELPPTRHGEWMATHVSGEHLLYGRTGGWRTIIEHPSGWRIEHFEAQREAYLFSPDRAEVGTLQVPKGAGIRIDDMISYARAWIESEGLTRGLPQLDRPG